MADFTFVCPAGVTKVKTDGCGASGRGFPGQTGGGSAAGGGGAYARTVQISVIPGNSYLVRRGDEPGGETLFINNTVMRAEGGHNASQSVGGAPGLAANSTGDVKYDGGPGGSVVPAAGAGAGGGGRGGRGGPGIAGESITALVAVPGGIGGLDGDGNLSGGDGGAGFDYFSGGHPGVAGLEDGAGGGGGGASSTGTLGGAGKEGWIAIYDDTTGGGSWPPSAPPIYSQGNVPPFPPTPQTAVKSAFVI